MVDLHRILPLVGDEVDGEETRDSAGEEDDTDDKTSGHVVVAIDGGLLEGRSRGRGWGS